MAGQDELILDESSRTKLDGIVGEMKKNNEPDENIQFVVSDFKTKYGKKSEQPKKESEIATVTVDENNSIVPKQDQEFDINNPTKAEGVINMPKGGAAGIQQKIYEDKAKVQKAEASEYVKKAKGEIMHAALSSDLSKKGDFYGNETPNNPEAFQNYVGNAQVLANPEANPEAPLEISDEERQQISDFALKTATVAPAIQKAAKNLEQNPDDIASWNEIADAHNSIGDTATALSLYSKANALSENWQSLQGLGSVYAQMGDNENAKKAFSESYKMNPDEVLPLSNLAYLDVKDGDFASADKKINELKQKFPNYPYSYALSSFNKAQQGDEIGAKADEKAYQIAWWAQNMPETTSMMDSDAMKERKANAERMGAIHDALNVPLKFFGDMETGTIEGMFEGVKKAGNAARKFDTGGSIADFLTVFTGVAEAGFSAAMAGVPVTNMAFHSLPEDVNKVLMQPLDILISLSGKEKENFSETGKALVDIGNILGSIAVLGAIHGKGGFSASESRKIDALVKAAEGKDNVKLKEIFNSIQTSTFQKAKEILNNSTVGELKRAATTFDGIPKDISDEVKLKVMPDVLEIERLETEKKNSASAFHPYIDKKIEALNAKVDAQLNEIVGKSEDVPVKAEEAPAKTEEAALVVESKTPNVGTKSDFEKESAAPAEKIKGENDAVNVTNEPIEKLPTEVKPKEVVAENIEDATPVEPKDGDTVSLPARIEGGMEQKFVFSDGEWKQQVGRETSAIGKPLQEKVAEKFAEQNSKEVTPVVEKKEVSKSVEKSEPATEEKVETPIEEKKEVKEDKRIVDRDKLKSGVSVGADAVKAFLKGTTPDGTKINGLSSDKFVDMVVKVIHSAIDAGASLEDAIRKGISHAKGRWDSRNGKFPEKEFADMMNVGKGEIKGKSLKKDLVKDSYYEPHLTDDGKGNYVFFHVSNADAKALKKGIDSRKFNSARTDKAEKGLQYGVASFYTKATDGERMVGGDKYAVTVPKDKVYPMDVDPNNYRELAEKKVKEGTPFREENIKKEMASLAEKDGYEMAVGEWYYDRGGVKTEEPQFRADALKPLKASEYKGDESFVPSTDKNIPHPEQDVVVAKRDFQSVAKEIADKKSSKGEYDEAYYIAKSISESGRVDVDPLDYSKGKREVTVKDLESLSEGISKKVQEKLSDAVDKIRIAKKKQAITEAANKLKQNPIFGGNSPKGTKKSGFDAESLIDGAVKVIHAAIDAGEAIDKAIKKGVEHIKAGWDKAKGEFPEKEINKILFDSVNKKEVQLIHAEGDAMRAEVGLEEGRKREAQTVVEMEAEADAIIKKGVDINKIADEILDGKKEGDEIDHIILSKRAAILEEQLNSLDPLSKEFSDALSEFRSVTDAASLSGSTHGKALGIRSHFKTVSDNSLGDYFLQEIELNKGAELTDNQKLVVKKEHEEISEARQKYEDRIKELEGDIKKLKSEKELERIAKKRDRAVKKEKLDEDFDAMAKEVRRITTINSGLNPEAVPIIMKMIKNRVDKGLTNLADVVDAVHSKLEEYGIAKSDIEDVLAGKYAKKMPTRTELAKNMFELRQELKLIEKIEALKNGIEPKTEKLKIERNQKLEELRKQIKEHDLTKIAEYKNRLRGQTEKIQKQIDSGNFEKAEKKKPLVLDAEAKKLKHEYIKKKQDRDIRILKQAYENRTKAEKRKDEIIEYLNIPRTIMSSMDFSAPLRQGLIASIAHPALAARAFREMFKQAGSQKVFDEWFHDVKEDPRYEIAKESGLFIADPHDVRLRAKEEAFMNNKAEKIPIGGALIKGSERAYVGYLNKMRWDVFNKLADLYESQGKTFDNSPKLYKALGDYVNNSTGRGKMGAFEDAAPLLNSVFFAPRLIASRVNMLTNWANPSWYKRAPKEIRVQYFKDMAKFISAGLVVTGLAKMNGAEVITDPSSSDFMKIKSGNTRWDIWGGHQQYISLVSQLIDAAENDKPASGIIGKFLRKKLSPIPSVAVNFYAGENVVGEETTVLGEIQGHMLPLIYSDVYDAVKEKGPSALFTVGGPAMFGVGTNTYPPRKSKKKPVKKSVKSGQNPLRQN